MPPCQLSRNQAPAPASLAPLTFLLAAGLRHSNAMWLRHSNAMWPGAPGSLWLLIPGGGEPQAVLQCSPCQWQPEAGVSGAGHGARAAQPTHRDALTPCQPTAVGAVEEKASLCEKNNWAVSRRAGLAASLVLPLSSTVKAMNCEP